MKRKTSEHAVTVAEMTIKDLDQYPSLLDEAEAWFERTKLRFSEIKCPQPASHATEKSRI